MSENFLKNTNWNEQLKIDNIEKYWDSTPEELSHRKFIANKIRPLLKSGDTVLDGGCGSGKIYEQLIPDLKDKKYLGIDGSLPFIQLARQKFQDAQFELNNLYALTFGNDSFDVVFNIDVIQHCQYYEQPIKELFRITKRVLFIRTWTHNAEDKLVYKPYCYDNIYNQNKFVKFLQTLSSKVEYDFKNKIYIIRK